MNITVQKSGSSFIAFMLYLVLFIWIVQIAFEWSTYLIIKSSKIDADSAQVIATSIVYDALRKDLVSAFNAPDQWHSISPQHLQCTTPHHRIEWSTDSRGITRTEGIYHASTGRISETKQVHFGADVPFFEYTIHQKNARVTIVSFWVGNKSYRMQGVVSPKGIWPL